MKARFYDPDLGQFLSQDSFEGTTDTPPSLHKYLYALENPTVYTDPTGNYNEGGHYYTTYYIALSVGYTPDEASTLAFYAQLPDEIRSLDAIATQTRNLQGQIESEERGNIQGTFHVLTGRDALHERKVSETIVRESSSLEATGLAIHRLGDSFSHTKIGTEQDDKPVTYKEGFGHLWHGVAPDQIHRRSELYGQYIEKLGTILLEKKKGTAATKDEIEKIQKTKETLVGLAIQQADKYVRKVKNQKGSKIREIGHNRADKETIREIKALVNNELKAKGVPEIDKKAGPENNRLHHLNVRGDIKGLTRRDMENYLSKTPIDPRTNKPVTDNYIEETFNKSVSAIEEVETLYHETEEKHDEP